MTPCISLWQPWASLIFTGYKAHETRAFRPPAKFLGTTIGIHATARFPPQHFVSAALHALCVRELGADYVTTLPLGCVVGTATLWGVRRTDTCAWWDADDHTSGDWTPGRFAWRLTDVHEFEQPVRAKGGQRWRYIDLKGVS